MLRRGKSYDTVRGIKEVWEKCYEIPVPSCGSITEVTFEECPIEQIGLAKQRRRRYGDICIRIVDSLCYKAETNTQL